MTGKDNTAAARAAEKSARVIGWREWASLPDLSVSRINAKIDTGAKTSAIHASRIDVAKADDGYWVEFLLHPHRGRKVPEIRCRLPLVDKRSVRSSNGRAEERMVINTPLQLGGEIWPVELTLANRDAMEYRLLIGRDALADRFLVRPDASYLLGKRNRMRHEPSVKEA